MKRVLDKLIVMYLKSKGKTLLLMICLIVQTLGVFYSETLDRVDKIEKAMNQSQEIMMSFRVPTGTSGHPGME